MVIGIVVDNAVHFLSRYLRARHEEGMSPEDSLRETFVSVGSTLVVNARVLAAGFALLRY